MKSVLTVILCLLFTAPALTQTFVKVTDPTNPVVTDIHNTGSGSWIDIDNDGYMDLFLANGNSVSQNNSIYYNLRNGNFRKVTTGNAVLDGGSSIGSTWGDYNRDGLLDLFVTNRFNVGNFMYTGTNDTVSLKVTSGSPVTDIANSNSSSWVDIDNDGDLDLYVLNFAGSDFVYVNNGPSNGFSLTRLDTVSMRNGNANSIVGSWADYNNDKLPDYFIGNGGSDADVLYTNHGNLFFTGSSFSDHTANLGASWGDYNNDGYLDLFVPSFLSGGNALYVNSGPPMYNLTRVEDGVVTGGAANSIGSGWGDYDNDGNLDLIVSNDGQNAFLYHNDGPPNYTFTKITTEIVANDAGNAFGCTWGDYDNDGQLDLFVSDRNGHASKLYHNTGNANHWITVRLQGTTSNPTAIGAKVRIKATINGLPRWQMQELVPQVGYNSTNLRLHFGLGDASSIDSLVIVWPRSADEVHTNVAPDRIVCFTEHLELASDLINPGLLERTDPAGTSFAWNSSSVRAPYTVQISSDSLFTRIVESDTTVHDTVYQSGALPSGGKLYWRVRSTQDPEGLWSPTGVFQAGIDTVMVNLRAKWNIIGFPMVHGEHLASVVFPDAASQPYTYSPGSGYSETDTLLPGRGYWLKFGAAQSTPVSGINATADTIQLQEGWNLVAGPSSSVSVASIVSSPSNIIISDFFQYAGAYQKASVLEPFHGYWVKASGAGTVILGEESMIRAKALRNR